jgi:hypothetical protein
MYHPAAALHQASLRETLFADVRGLPAALLTAREALEAERAASVQELVTLQSNPENRSPAERATDAEQLTLF